jgi:hypothetical protein
MNELILIYVRTFIRNRIIDQFYKVMFYTKYYLFIYENHKYKYFLFIEIFLLKNIMRLHQKKKINLYNHNDVSNTLLSYFLNQIEYLIMTFYHNLLKYLFFMQYFSFINLEG